MILPYFGQINLNQLDELYEVGIIINNQKNCNLELWFDEEQISDDKMQPLLNLLKRLPSIHKKGRDVLFETEKGQHFLHKYLKHHLKVLKNNEKIKIGIFDTDDFEIAFNKLKNSVYLKNISFFPETKGISIDYTIGHLITDYVICIELNFDLKIQEIHIAS